MGFPLKPPPTESIPSPLRRWFALFSAWARDRERFEKSIISGAEFKSASERLALKRGIVVDSSRVADMSSDTAVVSLTGHIIPSADNTYNIGSPAFRYKDIRQAGTAYLGGVSTTGPVTIAGILGVTGAVQFASGLTVSGNEQIVGGLTVSGLSFTTATGATLSIPNFYLAYGANTLRTLATNSGAAGNYTLTIDPVGANRTLTFGSAGVLTDRLTSVTGVTTTTLALTSTSTIATLTCSVATLRLASATTSFSPTTTNTQSWGSNTLRPLKIWAGSSGIDTSGPITLGAAATITGLLTPTNDSAYTIGDATHRWAEVRTIGLYFGDLTAPTFNLSFVSASTGTGFTADHQLTLALNDNDFILTITGNATLNQDVSTAGSPEFVDLNLNDTASAFRTMLRSTSSTTLTADRVLTLDVVNAARTLKLSGNATLNQDVSTAGSPSFTGLTASSATLGTVTLPDTGVNIILGTTTGTKIGTDAAQKLGFYNTTPVVQRTDVGLLDRSASGTADGTLADVGTTFNQGTLNDNFADCAERINAIRAALRTLGLMA